jgi:hypothetical protein
MRSFARNGATIGPRTHSPPAWRIGPAALQVGNSKRAGVGIGPRSAASLPQRQGCNLAAAPVQPKLQRMSVRYWSHRHKKSMLRNMPVCVHFGLGRRQRPEVRNGASSRWRSWSPDAAGDEAVTGADRVSLRCAAPFAIDRTALFVEVVVFVILCSPFRRTVGRGASNTTELAGDTPSCAGAASGINKMCMGVSADWRTHARWMPLFKKPA